MGFVRLEIGVVAVLVVAGGAAAQDVTATLADTVRDRGHPCAKAISALTVDAGLGKSPRSKEKRG